MFGVDKRYFAAVSIALICLTLYGLFVDSEPALDRHYHHRNDPVDQDILQIKKINDEKFVHANFVSNALSFPTFSFCSNYEKYSSLAGLTCNNATIFQRLKIALIMENCGVALKSEANAKMVAQKIRKLAANSQFIFFRGAAGLFDYNMMCSEEPETFKKEKATIPTVLSNGDCHPENFGVMVMANDGLVWGVNDFDQGFNAPFTWDLKRGATGFLVGCMSGDFSVSLCLETVNRFIDNYFLVFSEFLECKIPNQQRFLEGSENVERFGVIKDLIGDARAQDKKKKTKKFFEKKGVDVKNGRFFETDKVKPIGSPAEIARFQDAVEAYLYHGTPALAKFPNVNDFYKVLDVAVKLGSGTGSVGLNRYYILIKGRREEYGNIILEMKEQTRSILQSFFSYYVPDDQAAKRAVDSETAAFPYANIFYGWTRFNESTYVVREKSKHQVSLDITDLYPKEGNFTDHNWKFYKYVGTEDPHVTHKLTSITHQDIAKSVFAQFQNESLNEIERNHQDYNRNERTLLDYASASGRALAFYHIRARCESAKCDLDSPAFVDYETCENIQGFLRSSPDGSLARSVFIFSVAEAMRQEHSWKVLKQFVAKADAENRSVLEILVN